MAAISAASYNLNAKIAHVDSLSWDSSTLNGRLLLVATRANNSWSKLSPSAVAIDSISYDTVLPSPAPDDLSSNLGGYAIVGPRTFEIEVSGYQELTGSELRDSVSVCAFMGDRVSAMVNGIDNGLKLINESFNSTGISFNNYLALNHEAQFSLALRVRNTV